MHLLKVTAIGLFSCSGLATGQGFTVVNPPDDGGPTHGTMIGWALGGTFSAAGARDFSNGSLTAVRVADTGEGNDQVWDSGKYRATATRHEDHNHRNEQFGYIPDGSGDIGSYVNLFPGGDIGASAVVSIGEEFRWAAKFRQGNFEARTSNEGDNPGGQDHMITYMIMNGSNNLLGYMLFFENEEFDRRPDGDYNDMAVMLSLVPTPQAASLALLGGLGLAGRSRRRTVGLS